MKGKSQSRIRKIVGVDLHPDSFSAALVSGSSLQDMKLERQYTKLSCKEWESFLKGIPGGSIIVCEAGCNSFEFMKLAESFGHETFVLNSIHAGRIAKAYCKTDKRDALRSAKIYLCGLADRVWLPDEETLNRREIVSAYQQSFKDKTRSINRLKSFLTAHKVRLKKKANLSDPGVREYMFQAYSWSPTQSFVLKNMLKNYEECIEKRQRYYEFIASVVFKEPMMRKLMNLCGIRLLAAYQILSAIGDIRRFKTPKQLVAYLGVAPGISASGNKCVSTGLQRDGKGTIRSLLMEAAQSILRSKNAPAATLRKWGTSLMMRRGKNIALGGIARKLAVAVWYTLNGFLPEILGNEEAVKAKLNRLVTELKLPFISIVA